MSKEQCNKYLHPQGKDGPRACQVCNLGPCKFQSFGDPPPLVIIVDFFKPSGKWYAGGEVKLSPDTWPHSPDLKQQIVDNQKALQDGWQGNYIVVTDYNPDKSDRFFKSVYQPEEFMFVSKTKSKEKKTAAEWLNEPEFSDLILLDNWPVNTEYSREEFEEKLLASRVQVSSQKLKQMIQSK